MGPILDILDGRMLKHTLRKSEKKRLELMKATLARGETLPGWRVIRPLLYMFGGQFILMVVTSWVVSGDQTRGLVDFCSGPESPRNMLTAQLYLCFTVGGLQR